MWMSHFFYKKKYKQLQDAVKDTANPVTQILFFQHLQAFCTWENANSATKSLVKKKKKKKQCHHQRVWA